MSTKPTILFVDDEERILRSLKILFMTRYNVITTSSGYDALDIVKQKKVHVVVSDQRMPIMLGADLLRQVKSISPNSIRLLLTGYSDLQAIVASVNEGEIFRYINKPWQTEEIKGTIAKAVDIALRLEKTAQQIQSVDSEKLEHPAKTEEYLTTKRLNLLVLDEDENTFNIISKLSDNAYTTYWARTLDEALHMLDAEKISLLISDVQLNGEDITTSIKVLKEYNHNIITIILTAFQDTKALINLINQGQIYRFLPKPIHESLLAKSLAAAVNHYQTLQATPKLLACHEIEATGREESSEAKISNKVLSFIDRIRGRHNKDSN